MMDGTKQSDSSIVAMKRANKEGRPSAEPVERRDGTKGNSVSQSTRRTQSRGSVSQAVDRIRRAIARNPKERLTALLHHITVEALRRAYLGAERRMLRRESMGYGGRSTGRSWKSDCWTCIAACTGARTERLPSGG